MERRFVLKLFAVIFFISFFSSCSSNNDDLIIEDENNYYVKYEFKVSYGWNRNYVCEVNYMTDHGEESFKKVGVDNTNSGVSWEATYGPFRKNDKVYLKINTGWNSGLMSRISVSKNNEPFVIKAENKFTLTYIIDY